MANYSQLDYYMTTLIKYSQVDYNSSYSLDERTFKKNCVCHFKGQGYNKSELVSHDLQCFNS